MRIQIRDKECSRGYREEEIELEKVNTLGNMLKLVGIDKTLVQLTKKSFKELKKTLEKRHMLQEIPQL